TYGSQPDPASHLPPDAPAAPPPALAPSALAHGIDANGRVTDHQGEALVLRDRAVDRMVRGSHPKVRRGARPKAQQRQGGDPGHRHGG
ncbi:MAG: hypothetical protein JWP73_1972, partial [Phenylobacterium sp.]|nr:hypothetical protein [Phenylobacterium sp.]